MRRAARTAGTFAGIDGIFEKKGMGIEHRRSPVLRSARRHPYSSEGGFRPARPQQDAQGRKVPALPISLAKAEPTA